MPIFHFPPGWGLPWGGGVWVRGPLSKNISAAENGGKSSLEGNRLSWTAHRPGGGGSSRPTPPPCPGGPNFQKIPGPDHPLRSKGRPTENDIGMAKMTSFWPRSGAGPLILAPKIGQNTSLGFLLHKNLCKMPRILRQSIGR